MPGFCHCCGEEARGSHAAHCRNRHDLLANGQPACTKVICRACFDAYGWDFREAANSSSWTCTHCRGVCPRCCLVPVAPPRAGSLAAQAAHAEHTARYLAYLQSLTTANQTHNEFPDQPSSFAVSGGAGGVAQPPHDSGVGGLVDRFASMLAADQSATGAWLANAITGSDHHHGGGEGGGAAAYAAPHAGTHAADAAGSCGIGGDDGGPRPDAVWGVHGEERLACWGCPRVSGDAWGHESSAGAAVVLRTGGSGSSGSSGRTQAQPLLVLVGGRATAGVSANGSVVADTGSGRAGGGSGASGVGTLVQVFDPEAKRWLAVRQSGVPPVRLRAHACCAFEGGRLLVSGGGDGKRISSELFALHLTTAAGGSPPAAAAGGLGGGGIGSDGMGGGSGGSGGGLAAAVAAVADAAVTTAAAVAGVGGMGDAGLGGGGVLTAVDAVWSHPQVRGAAPPARVGHCAARMGSASMLIFGGFALDPSSCDGGRGEGGGGGEASAGSAPRHGKRRDKSGSGGGGGSGGSYSNALYALNAERGAWSMPTVHIAPGSVPPLARLGATATPLHEHEVLLFGGSHGGQPSAALDVLSANADLGSRDAVLRVGQPVTTGTPPAPRFNHCACLLGLTDVAIFGGAGGHGGRAPLCDVHLLDTTQMRWAVLEFRGVPPAPRSSGVGLVVGAERRLWIFGGVASVESRPFNDVHTLDVSRRVDAGPGGATAKAAAGSCGGGIPVVGATAGGGVVAKVGAGRAAAPAHLEGGAAGGGYGGACGGGGGGARGGVGKAPSPLHPEVGQGAKRLRPPPLARLAPSSQELQPLLPSAPLRPLALMPAKDPRPEALSPTPPAASPSGALAAPTAEKGADAALGGRTSPLLSPTPAEVERALRPTSVANPSAPVPPVLRAQNVVVTPAFNAPAAAAAPDGMVAPEAGPPAATCPPDVAMRPDEHEPASTASDIPVPLPASSEAPPITEMPSDLIAPCTTVLVRRNGAYVMKVVKADGCTGCDVCHKGREHVVL
jgi:hypothetical protein